MHRSAQNSPWVVYTGLLPRFALVHLLILGEFPSSSSHFQLLHLKHQKLKRARILHFQSHGNGKG